MLKSKFLLKCLLILNNGYLMPKIPFTVSARTAKLIGQENFANAEGAIIELVKNAYDADANNCIIIFDNSVTSNASIYVIDNGIGMTEDIIYDSWMTIGTNNKETNHTSIATGRIRTGAKGIGRFALDRLGSQSTIYTFPEKKEKNHFIWKVEWNKFNVNNAKIHEVKANIRNIRNISPVSILSKKFSQYEHINKHIKLLDKRKWNKGTILKIEKIKDNWTTEDLDNLYKNLEVLTPPIEQKSDFQIHLFCTEDVYKEKYGEIEAVAYDDYDYKMSFKYLANENKEVEVKIFRNELNIKELIDNYSEVFSHDELQNIRYNKDSFYKDVIEFTTSLSSFKKLEGTSQVLFDQLGEFDFTFYYIKNLEPNKEDKLVYPYKSFNTSFRKTWLEKYSGIKIFRDGFRVRPYGENGNDWLNLGERQAQSPAGAGQRKGGFRIRPNQISGTIHISRLKNKSFEDKSGREGLQENESFKLFKNILLELIKIFEKDRNIIMYNLSQLQKNKEEEIKKIAREEAEKIEKEQELRERKEQKSQQDNQSNNADNDKQNNRDEILQKQL